MSWQCANCGIHFGWQPTLVDGRTYCCVGCSQGGPCTCDYEQLPRTETVAGLALRVVSLTVRQQRDDEAPAVRRRPL